MSRTDVEATGPHGKKLEKLVDLIAASPTFIAAVDNGAERDHIFHPVLTVKTSPDNPLAIQERVTFPIAVVQNAGEFQFVKQGVSDGGHFRPRGALLLSLFDRCRDPDHLGNSEMHFTNFWDGVLADIVRASGSNTSLTVSGTQMQTPPQRSPQRQENVVGDYWGCRHIIRYSDV